MSNFNNCKVCQGTIVTVNQTYHLAKCENCDLIFCTKQFSQEDFVAVYDALYNKENSEYQRHSAVEFNEILTKTKVAVGFNRGNLIKKNILKPKVQSVLEIGSGIGLVGNYIRTKDSAIHYTGIELDTEAFKKSQLLKLNTLNGDFTEMEKLNQEFDVIMLWEVIEHLQDLDCFMKLAYQKLKVGGKIILSAPNYDKINNYPNRIKDQLFQNEPPIHLNFFTKKSFLTVFEHYGFQNIKVNVKKTPYLELKKIRYYVNLLKAVFNKYEGATIYVEAQK